MKAILLILSLAAGDLLAPPRAFATLQDCVAVAVEEQRQAPGAAWATCVPAMEHRP